MKNLTLILFAALMLLGWTSVAAGLIAALAGEPTFVSRPHSHVVTPPPEPLFEPAPLRADKTCAPGATPDASVPCEV